MTSKQFSPWRTRLAVVATGFAALGALTTVKAHAVVPSVSVFNVHMSEGNVGNKLMPFSVKLSMASPAPQWVQLQPGIGGPTPATAAKDFNSAGPYLVNFGPGETAKVVNVPVIGDTLDEYDETFVLNVVAHSPGIGVTDGQGIGQITDDDAAPTISVNDVNKKEGTGVITPFLFTAKLSAPSAKTIKVSGVGQSGTAHIPDDLTAGPATLTFNPGVTSQTYKASVNGDAAVEPNEAFTVQLSGPANATLGDAVGLGTIVNDDTLVANPQPQPQPQPDPQPQPNPGNGGVIVGGTGGTNGGGTNGGGGSAIDTATSDNGVAGTGEQALGPNAAIDAKPAQHSVDWTMAALLTLLGMCLAGLVAVGFVIARQRRERAA